MVGYDRTNQFRVYNLRTQKVYVERNVDVNEVSIDLTSGRNSDNMAACLKIMMLYLVMKMKRFVTICHLTELHLMKQQKVQDDQLKHESRPSLLRGLFDTMQVAVPITLKRCGNHLRLVPIDSVTVSAQWS